MRGYPLDPGTWFVHEFGDSGKASLEQLTHPTDVKVVRPEHHISSRV